MAKFIFKMESILVIKYKLEDQAKIQYGLAIERLRHEEEILQHMIERKAGYEESLAAIMFEQLDLFKIKELENAIEVMKYKIVEQQVAVKNAELKVEAARMELNDAMKERKIYERLKEKAFEEFKQEVQKEEQKEVDELVSFRFGNGKVSED